MIKKHKKIILTTISLFSSVFVGSLIVACKTQEPNQDEIRKDVNYQIDVINLNETEIRDKITDAKIKVVLKDEQQNLNNNNILVKFSNTSYFSTTIKKEDDQTFFNLIVNNNELNKNNFLEEIWIEKDHYNSSNKTMMHENKNYILVYKNSDKDFFIDNSLDFFNLNTILLESGLYNITLNLKGNENIIKSPNLNYKINLKTHNNVIDEYISSNLLEAKNNKLSNDFDLIPNRKYHIHNVKVISKTNNKEFDQEIEDSYVITPSSKTKITKNNNFKINNENGSLKLRFDVHSQDQIFNENDLFSIKIETDDSNHDSKIVLARIKKELNNKLILETDSILNLQKNINYKLTKIVFGDDINVNKKPNMAYDYIDIGFYESINDLSTSQISFMINDQQKEQQNELKNQEDEKNKLENFINNFETLNPTSLALNTNSDVILNDLKNSDNLIKKYIDINENQDFSYSFNFQNAFINDSNGNIENVNLTLSSKKYSSISKSKVLSLNNLKTRVITNFDNINLYKAHFPSLVMAAIVYNINKKNNTQEYKDQIRFENKKIKETTENEFSSKNFLSFNRLFENYKNDYFNDSSVDFNETMLENLLFLKHEQDQEKYYLEIVSATASDINGTLSIGYKLINKENNAEIINESITLYNFLKLNQEEFKKTENNYFRVSIFDWLNFRKNISKRVKKWVDEQKVNKKEIDLLSRLSHINSGYWNKFFAYSIYEDSLTNSNYDQKNYHEISEYATLQRYGVYPLIYYTDSLINIKSIKIVLNEDSQNEGKLIIKYTKQLDVLDDQNNLIDSFNQINFFNSIESNEITQEINVDLTKAEW